MLLKRHGKWKNKSVFVVYLLSNLLLLVIPAAVLIGSTYATARLNEAAVAESSMQIGRQFQQALDNGFDEMEEIYQALFQDGFVSKLLYRQGMLNSYDYYNSVQITQQLSLLRSANTFVSDVYLYFPANGSIVTPSYRLDCQTYYARMYQYEGLSCAQWTQMLEQGYAQLTPVGIPLLDADGRDQRMLCFVRTLYITTELKYNPVAVFFVSGDKLGAMMEELLGLAGMSGEIVDNRQEQVIFGSGPVNLSSGVMTLSSIVPDWSYRVYTDAGVLWARYTTALRTVLLSAAVGFALNILAAVLLAYNNYAPIRNILRRIIGGNPPVTTGDNEIRQIEAVLENTFAQRMALQEKVTRLEPVYINHYLYQLLKGTVAPQQRTIETMRLYGVELIGQRFSIVNVLLLQTGSFRYEQDEKEFELVHMMIQNVMDELFERIARISYIYHEQKTITALMNLSDQCSAQMIQSRIGAMHRFFQKQMNMQLAIFVGETVQEAAQLPAAYSQAEQAMRYASFKSYCGVIGYDDIKDEPIGFSTYTIDDEIQLMNLIRTGDVPGVTRRLEALFDQNVATQSFHSSSVQGFLVQLMSTYLKTARQMRFETQVAPDLQGWQLSEAQLRTRYLALYQELTQFAGQKGEKANRLIKQIETYVRQSYADDQLSVALLASRVGLNASYLSTVYKEATGENLSDYIHAVRMNCAKRLLQDPTLTLNKIAFLCGYRSDVTFIRTFKKYEGVTPGNYRKNLAGQQ